MKKKLYNKCSIASKIRTKTETIECYDKRIPKISVRNKLDRKHLKLKCHVKSVGLEAELKSFVIVALDYILVNRKHKNTLKKRIL